MPVVQNAVAVQPLPPDVTMTVTRTGTEPPVILVARNGEEWRVADGNWGGLPADLQPFVAPLMATNNAAVAASGQLPAETVAQEADVRELRREIEELKQLVRQSLNDR
jgi:hypothetical protein